jgi:hypothetical protein
MQDSLWPMHVTSLKTYATNRPSFDITPKSDGEAIDSFALPMCLTHWWPQAPPFVFSLLLVYRCHCLISHMYMLPMSSSLHVLFVSHSHAIVSETRVASLSAPTLVTFPSLFICSFYPRSFVLLHVLRFRWLEHGQLHRSRMKERWWCNRSIYCPAKVFIWDHAEVL